MKHNPDFNDVKYLETVQDGDIVTVV